MSDIPAHCITVPRGFRASATTCGIKRSGTPDLALIVCDGPARAAACFTKNAFVGAPVEIGRKHMKTGYCRAIIINSGCSNVATGREGIDNALAICASVGEQVGAKTTEILPASTGVIGHQLPMQKILPALPGLVRQLASGAEADKAAAEAILTTDTRAKSALQKFKIGSKTVRIGGIAKGSGMISPNLATMLVFITTDANITAPLLRSALKAAVDADASFNRISVDSDTSTSDTVAILASGMAGHEPIRDRGAEYEKFAAALTRLCKDLAYQVISDGEGLEHVIRVKVDSAASGADALRVARAVADSPLVKTAIHGSDPNWGRLAMAAGKCGAKLEPKKLVIRIGKTTVFRNGQPTRFEPADVSNAMKAAEVLVRLSLNLGKGTSEFLGCDLTREYITINADYHT